MAIPEAVHEVMVRRRSTVRSRRTLDVHTLLTNTPELNVGSMCQYTWLRRLPGVTGPVSLDGFFEGPDRELDWQVVGDELLGHLND
jgi:hypothetical protein